MSDDSNQEPGVLPLTEPSPATGIKKNVSGTEESPGKEKKPKKRKMPLLFRFFRFVVLFVLFLFLVTELVFFLTRIAPGSVIPDNFAAYAVVQNPAGLAEKVLDHESLPAIMSNPALVSLTPVLNQLKNSGLLQNRWARFALQGRLSAALVDTNGSFIAAWDSGFLAPLLRLMPFIAPRLNAPDLYYVQGNLSRFEYRSGNSVFYIAPKRNLMIFSNNEKLFGAVFQSDGAEYSPGKSIVGKKNDLSLLLSSKTVVSTLGENNPLLTSAIRELNFPPFLELGLIVERSRLDISLTVPVETGNEAFTRILEKNSVPPSLMAILPDTTQYCTGLSAGSFEELLGVLSVVTGASLQNSLDTADKASRMLLGLSLDDLLYSWTASEFAVFGLEERPSPIFAVKIGNEAKRQEVFDKAFSTLFLDEDTRFVLDGNRIPQIRLPSFIDAILRFMEINIPTPYYTVHEGWLLVSESPENLLAAVNSVRQNNILPRTEIWRTLTAVGDDNAALSLFYSLDRSLPFFLKGGSPAASLLRLYRQGLLRVSVKDSVLGFSLSIVPGAGKGVEPVPGYPISLGGRIGSQVYTVTNAAGTESRVLLTRGNSALAVNPADHAVYELKGEDSVWVIPAEGPRPRSLGESAAWVLSSRGLVTLVNGNMEASPPFPVITGIKPSAAPAAWGGKLYLAAEDGEKGVLYSMDAKGELNRIGPEYSATVLSAPMFMENTGRTPQESLMAFYPKSFLGELYVTRLDGEALPGWPVFAPNIAYGSPLLFKAGGNQASGNFMMGFVTMAGELNVYGEDGSVIPGFPIQLDGVFFLQPVWDGTFLWLVSEEGILYQVDMYGAAVEQRVSGLKVKENGFIETFDVDGDGTPEVFITGEGNALYGFSRSLNTLEGFPLPVWGKPVFGDFDGDGSVECIGAGWTTNSTGGNSNETNKAVRGLPFFRRKKIRVVLCDRRGDLSFRMPVDADRPSLLVRGRPCRDRGT
ncbi:MAG: VCBS repeat-containing protein [Treponema sp.]|nr:VCBS repeat-containing protein [Treponema sp.]